MEVAQTSWDRRSIPEGVYTCEAIRRLLTLPFHQQHTNEWHYERDNRLTASDCAAAIGQNPYSSPKVVFRKKINESAYVVGNAATRFGSYWEAHAISEYERRMHKHVFVFGCNAHPVYKW